MADRKNDGEKPDLVGIMAGLMPPDIPEEIRRFVAMRILGNPRIVEGLVKARGNGGIDEETKKIITGEIDRGVDDFFDMKIRAAASGAGPGGDDGKKIAGIIFIGPGGGAAVEGAVLERTKVEKPRKYNVVFHNDDVTPMGFVVEILVNVFSMDRESAAKLMMDIHTTGKGIAGTYIKSVAEMKVMLVRDTAEKRGYPLHVTMEME